MSYNYTDYGETEILGNQDFYNEVCYGAGSYDDTTGLYYLNARYYSPENAAFLTQDISSIALSLRKVIVENTQKKKYGLFLKKHVYYQIK